MLNGEDVPYFVDATWLSENLSHSNIRILDATWGVPGNKDDLPDGVIPGARFFDLGYLKSKTSLGDAYPPKDVMKNMAEELGIKPENHIIIYDKQGYFSGPRVWWSFKTIGHKKVSVLRDGFPAWLAKGYEIASHHQEETSTSEYETSDSSVKGITIESVSNAIGSDTQIIDARPAARFCGESPEPREGLRSGHIPGSINLPLGQLKNSQGELLENSEIRQILKNNNIDLNKPIITSCGSGVTAAALAFIFECLGAEDVSVYTGSWAEYGASDYPIETS
jgi:thiosulfate/3-mercaptopyruvate sulfurtransferase